MLIWLKIRRLLENTLAEAIFELIFLLVVRNKVVNKWSIVLKWKFFIVINTDNNRICSLHNFLFAQELLHEGVKKYLLHCRSFIWIEV